MDKDFTTFEEQVKILKRRGLKFTSEETALKALQRFGYYSIINGYKDPYVDIIAGKEVYKEGVTFEQIYSLYRMDRGIRNALIASMLEVEDNLRTAVAHVLAETYGADQNLYLNPINFRSGKSGKHQLNDILKKFNKIITDNDQPMKHYRETYGNVPPWILLKGASFGNLANFIKLQKGPQKEKILSLIYDSPLSFIQGRPEIKNLFMDTLFVCLDYRNRAAHGGRIYNFETKATFRYSPILHAKLKITPADYRAGKGASGLPTLLAAINFMDNREPAIYTEVSINYYLEKHLSLYPDDEVYLSSFLKADL